MNKGYKLLLGLFLGSIELGTLMLILACCFTGGWHSLSAETEILNTTRMVVSEGDILTGGSFHQRFAFRGSVVDVALSELTLDSSLDWAVDRYSVVAGAPRFCLLVFADAVQEPGQEGDWWTIESSGSNSIVLNTNGIDLTERISPGDIIEIRPLFTLEDLFGENPALLLNTDSNGSTNPAEEDVLYLLDGASFEKSIVYHDGSIEEAGFYVNGSGPYEGQDITLLPDQPIVISRMAGSSDLELTVSGQIQLTRFTHKLAYGPNVITTAFAKDQLLAESGLVESGWKSNSNLSPAIGVDDLIFSLDGTAFDEQIFYHDGSQETEGWYVDDDLDNEKVLKSGSGYLFFITDSEGLQWSEPPPY